MGLAMNRFLLMPKPKPEFKMVQPLPAFIGVPTARRDFAGALESAPSGLRDNDLPMLPAGTKIESFTTVRNMAS